ncbi:MAG TPA: sulfite exporter TauE/SafE family protein [Candidatus Competibacteraceae bacterium]|nr:MAG: sulfite exporter TauE/SafE family protein [Candidatus Competibacteraceae bacterium]HOB63393.1 sulfite exporter TauE/SafE family protein [Candidatus Competibacteraceae bacterium]HQA27326.1 sulfite exporter TauE/SafE family protein [Candidatus Competibacteraceae bacterium]HQD57815.1 sulfite exporter TauE/SafE family protein [Candidatus Competibacteraceae bacterium]
MISLLFGLIVGFSLGLTGGGGSIFAVPLLVYGLAIPPHEAVGVSLAAVGATALVGAITRLRRREVELKAAILFGMAGVVGAPLGSMLGVRLPAHILMVGFALLMLMIAARLWRQAVRRPGDARVVRAGDDTHDPAADSGPACRVSPSGALTLTSRCAVVLLLTGVTTGVLSGLFGVGGGFLIVPALVLIVSLPMHRAVPTSLLVIAIISVSGTLAYLLSGRPLALGVTIPFVLGGLAGMAVGVRLSRRLAGPQLQKLFALLMVGVAIFTLIEEIYR